MLLQDAYKYIKDRIKPLSKNRIKEFLNCVKELEVLEFIEEDERKAIRIFQTVFKQLMIGENHYLIWKKLKVY